MLLEWALLRLGLVALVRTETREKSLQCVSFNHISAFFSHYNGPNSNCDKVHLANSPGERNEEENISEMILSLKV